MELLGDVGHAEPCFGPFGDSISVGARYVHGLCRTYHMIRNHRVHLIELLDDEGYVESRFVLF
jgi:hypothetical protein